MLSLSASSRCYRRPRGADTRSNRQLRAAEPRTHSRLGPPPSPEVPRKLTDGPAPEAHWPAEAGGGRRWGIGIDPKPEAATKRGDVANVSAWVNEAMRLKLEHDRGLAELARVIADFESEHGKITNEEIEAAARLARSRAVSVRGARTGETSAGWRAARARGRRS